MLALSVPQGMRYLVQSQHLCLNACVTAIKADCVETCIVNIRSKNLVWSLILHILFCAHVNVHLLHVCINALKEYI